MVNTLIGYARACARRIIGPLGPVPTPEQLERNALRHAVGTGFVVLAAAIVHRTGNTDQDWAYLAMAVALTPQVLLGVLAAGDPDRRKRLRATTRPAPIPLLVATVLVVATAVLLLSGNALAPAMAALVAAGGFAIAAAPVTVMFSPRDA